MLEEEAPTIPAKLIKTYISQPWWVRVLIATLPSLVTAYFSYRASVVETKSTAEAGYDALVKAVETLQKHDEQSTRSIYQLGGHVSAIEAWMTSMHPHAGTDTKELHLDLDVPKNAPDRYNWKPNFPPKMIPPTASKVDLPKSLEEATKK